MSATKEPTTKELNALYKAILELQSVEECKKFFRDLCTVSEISAMTERLQIMKMVNEGVSYRAIAEKTGASTATITRVAHWLHHGKGGYKLVLERIA